MSSRKPAVAVLTPFYGQMNRLESSLRSLARESVPHDVIVVDDGNAVPVVVPSGWHPSVILLRHDRNRGITEARNTALEYAVKAGYEYIAKLDAGDRSLAGRLQKQIAFLQQNSNCKLVGGCALFTDESGRALLTFAPPRSSEEIRRSLHRRCCFVHSTVMFRADVVQKIGMYREKYPAAEDYDFLFRVAETFATANLPEVLVEYEVSPQSDSSRRRRAQLVSRLRIVLAHFDPLLRQSYQGVMETLVSLTVSRSTTTRFREIQARIRDAVAGE